MFSLPSGSRTASETTSRRTSSRRHRSEPFRPRSQPRWHSTDLRPKNVEPPLRWEYGFTTRILYPVFLTPTRVWAMTDSKIVTALNKIDKKVEVLEPVADPISAPAGQAGVTAYVPLGSGYLVSVDAESGNLAGGANIYWRTPVGGINNRTPFLTETLAYASGDNSGVAAVDRKSGSIVWKSDDSVDRLIAANHEFVYLRDRQGRFLVYDAKRATDPARKRSTALSSVDLSEFNVHIVNTASDRVYLAADNGLIVCMRDMSPKYARPVRISPEPAINAPPRDAVINQPGKDGEPKKDPETKIEPKKDAEPKKDPEPKKKM